MALGGNTSDISAELRILTCGPPSLIANKIDADDAK
jgi:hypothetical protein